MAVSLTGEPLRALVIQHDPFAFPGYVGDRLAAHGFELQSLTVAPSMHDMNPHVDFGDPSDFDLIVPLGAVWSVYDRDTIGNWIGAELALVAAAVEADIPVLGLCFGGQVLSAALGGTVERAPIAEIGWHRIESAKKAEIFSTGPWMQWHYDRFSVPSGAELLAENDAAPQAFTIGRSLGLQFHPEVDVDIVATWVESAGVDGPEVDGHNLDDVLAETRLHASGAEARTHALVDWFLTDVAALPTTSEVAVR